MTILSRIAAAFHALRGKAHTGGVTYYFDRKKGIVELRTDPRLIVRMELFKRFQKSRNWGFELTIRNKSPETVEELLIVINKKFSIIMDKMRPDSMKIKSLEFSPEEFDTEELMMDLSVVLMQGKKQASEAYSLTVPMASILKELRQLGKVISIEEDEPEPSRLDRTIVEGFEAQFIKQASIKPRVEVRASGQNESKEAMQQKLMELDSQKQEITKSFMKREIDYTTFSQLMNPIVQETILIKSQLSKLND